LLSVPAIDFAPCFQPLFEPHRFKVCAGGRGRGASWAISRALILRATQKKIRILCVREVQKSIKESCHAIIKSQIETLGLSSIFIVQNDTIICTLTGSEFLFKGIKFNVDDIKSTEDVDIVWAEEAVHISENSWKVLIPTIRKSNYSSDHFLKGSEIWLSFNPDLESDYTYQYFILNPPPDCAIMRTTYRDNPWFPEVLKAEMEHMRVTNYNDYLWIWEGECRALTSGAVYGEELQEAFDNNRLTRVPYIPGSPVTTYWDLGRRGMTAIIFSQTFGLMENIIHFYQNANKDLDHYWKYMQERSYLYGYCILPHDSEHQVIGRKVSIKGQFEDAGFKTKVVPRLSISTGIEHTRSLFPRLLIDVENSVELLSALRHYRYDIVESFANGVQVFSKEPVKDGINDHACDALRMKGVAHKLWPRHTKYVPVEMQIEPVISPSPSPSGAYSDMLRIEQAKYGGTGWMKG
jgi:phage terminase large subunit